MCRPGSQLVAPRSSGGDRTPFRVRPAAEAVNEELRTAVVEVSVFIGFHYARGSAFDTPFWRDARSRGHHELDTSVPRVIRERFDRHLEVGSALDADQVRAAADRGELTRALDGADPSPTFGGFSVAGFSQVAAGIGYEV